ncbi:MAG: NUDIX domain-containing protein [Candidatus Aenigmarchaeota archaeon]|nr:NUDIX domain-containing protein [Candidatus Aenigmarchaeota archaeon]
MAEYFDVVDERDNVVGKATREQCHSDNKLIHRDIHIIIVSARGKILLEKRTMSRDLYPGKWGDVGGHVRAGETYEEAAKRELKEELGIKAPLEFLADMKKRVREESENIRLFSCASNGPFSINEEEVEYAKFFDAEEINRMIRNNPGTFTPGTLLCLRKFFEVKE